MSDIDLSEAHEAAETYSSRWSETRGLMERLAIETHFKAGWRAAEAAVREQIAREIECRRERHPAVNEAGSAWSIGMGEAARIARGES